MDKDSRLMSAAVIMAGYCANPHFANFTAFYLAEMAVEAVNELEKRIGCGVKITKGQNVSK